MKSLITIARAVREFRGRTDGAMTQLYLLTFLGVLIVGGLAVDLSNVWMVKNRMQVAADAAALAAVREMPDTAAARAKAIEYVGKNLQQSLYGAPEDITEVRFGEWDSETGTLDTSSTSPNAMSVEIIKTQAKGGMIPTLALGLVGRDGWEFGTQALSSYQPGNCTAPINLGGLVDYLFYFGDPTSKAEWKDATAGYIGDVAVNGLVANEVGEANIHFDGTIYTNDDNVGGWLTILDENPSTTSASYNQTTRISGLRSDFDAVVADIAGLTVTPGYEAVSPKDIGNLDFENGSAEVIVIDVFKDMKINFQWVIRGDADDLIVMRWDEKPAEPGYESKVKFENGGAIVPRGGLKPQNFVHLAGEIEGGGDKPPPTELAPYLSPLPGTLKVGGYFTGYWLTTGKPSDRKQVTFKDAVIIGGWYTTAIEFKLESDASGVHVAPLASSPTAPCAATSSTAFTGKLQN